MGAILPTWLEKAEDLRYIGTGVLEFDLDPDTVVFNLLPQTKDFILQHNEIVFDLAQKNLTFAPVHQSYDWQGNSPAVVFTLTRVEV